MTNVLRKETLATLRDVAVIGTIYVYFTGWTYVQYYYSFFGLTLDVVGVPFYSVLAYSPNVLTQPVAIPNKVVGLVAVAFSLTLLKWKPRWRVPVLGALLCLAFPFLAGMSYTAAKQIVSERLAKEQFPQVAFMLKDAPKALEGPSSRFLEANSRGQLRLLAQTSETYFVFLDPGLTPTSGDSSKLEVYYVQRAEVVLARLLPRTLRGAGP